MRRELLTLTALFLVLILATSMVSAIEMRRTHNFETHESKTYNFLGKDYTIRMLLAQKGNDGMVDLDINGYKEQIRGKVPAVFEELKITINEVGNGQAILNMVWEREDTQPDAIFQLPENFKKQVTAKGKKFDVLVTNLNKLENRADITVNGEALNLGENEKATLKDKSIIKMRSIAGTSIRNIQFSLWASDVKVEYEEEETYDAKARVGEREQKIIMARGLPINVKVEDISSQGLIKATIMQNKLTGDEGASFTLENGITVEFLQLSLKSPASVLFGINVPEELEEEDSTIVISRTLTPSRKDEFEAEGRTIVTRVTSIFEDQGTFVVNDKNFTIKLGQNAKVGDVMVSARILNPYSYPAKAILDYEIPKKVSVKKKAEEKRAEEDEVFCTQEVFECPDGTFVSRNPENNCKFDQCPEEEKDITEEEIPEPEMQEETKKPEPEYNGEVLGFTESVKWTFKNIGTFLKSLVNL